jgi:hypothetical protein
MELRKAWRENLMKQLKVLLKTHQPVALIKTLSQLLVKSINLIISSQSKQILKSNNNPIGNQSSHKGNPQLRSQLLQQDKLLLKEVAVERTRLVTKLYFSRVEIKLLNPPLIKLIRYQLMLCIQKADRPGVRNKWFPLRFMCVLANTMTASSQICDRFLIT